MDETSNISSKSTFPILCSFQMFSGCARGMWNVRSNSTISDFHVSSGSKPLTTKAPFQPWHRSDGHQFYWGGSGCGVTGRCKCQSNWKGVGMGMDGREMLNASKITGEKSWKEFGCVLCNTSAWDNEKYLYEYGGVGSWLLECGTLNLFLCCEDGALLISHNNSGCPSMLVLFICRLSGRHVAQISASVSKAWFLSISLHVQEM